MPASGAVIRHRDIGDYLTRERKLEIVSESDLNGDGWLAVEPNEHGDWINQRSERFQTLRPLISLPGEQEHASPLFTLESNGLKTNRDAYVLNSSGSSLRERVADQIEFFNAQAALTDKGDDWPERNLSRFKWDREIERFARVGRVASVNESSFQTAAYRPFFKQRLYMDRALNNMVYQLESVFPIPTAANQAIVIESHLPAPGAANGLLAVNAVPNVKTTSGAVGGANRVFPRYRYDAQAENEKSSIFSVDGNRIAVDNITDQALAAYQSRYGDDVTSDHIFAYVYGILHSPDYRERYATDLAKMLPRIPEVSTAEAFYAFSEAGQDLLDLHIGYEEVEPYPLEEVWSGEAPTDDERWYVRKMKWAGTSKAKDRSAIVVNDWLTLRGIPEEAHRYVVGPRSALDWLIDRYRVRTDKPSGIVNDPNDWGLELDPPQPDYIPTLLKRIVTVSLETMRLVDSLPPLEEAD